jgi:NAD(P)-dependent dehydrogenase (short-subunit alcohol dehydrogenase family)
MAMEPVLVTGAAGGQQGSTGLLVTRLLLERGQAVRAFVHRDDERAARLRTLGAEVVTGDLREITSVLPAVRGVRRAFFTYQVTGGLLDAAGAFAAAARQEGCNGSSRCRSWPHRRMLPLPGCGSTGWRSRFRLGRHRRGASASGGLLREPGRPRRVPRRW